MPDIEAKSFTEAFKVAVNNYTDRTAGKPPSVAFITEQHWCAVRDEVLAVTRYKLDDGYELASPLDESGLPIGGYIWFFGVRLIVLDDMGLALL